MSEAFQASLLISMPQLQDPNFARTVVLLCDYGPDGAFGLVINRPTEVPATDMVRLEPPVAAGNGMPLWIGGPVEPQRGWIPPGEAGGKFAHPRRPHPSTPALREVLEARPAAPACLRVTRAGAGALATNSPSRPG
jgi:hypothetical protein